MIEKIKSNPRLKAFVLWSIAPKRNPKPRLWVKWFVNPFIHKKGKGSTIRRRSRIDVFPWNRFEIGKLTTIEDFCTVNNGSGPVLLGDRVRVGIGSVIIGPVRMGSGSGLGQHVFVAGFNHGYSDGGRNSSQQPLDIKPTIIEEEAHIGANSVVVAGVTIGKRSQVGAGSVVTKDIPPFCVAVGNPAKVVKRFNHEKEIWERVSEN
ncbi:acyltransferase [Marinifilum flexuosum]|uniref:Acetyltransferase-like isoleucine patch superfamily enzyme n=1 Tax=Marinifilum flexuosum TaxID=1117708 RepID=A0A419X3E9_9BACT|nr:acyltransferase [Marinifilum flexuosum]RKE02139.1 acetyltransferase-like isoleucine patch superfamily enzyme [Marinifilum flexuosum]